MQLEAERQRREEVVQRKYHEHLLKVADGDDEAVALVGSVEKWMSFASSGMTISQQGYPRIVKKV